jgi:pyruvate/2-oxoglutarate dehydrogenase complex dihydrolipoamide dehydrogenase (E3) component
MITVEGLEESNTLTNQNIFELQDVPEKLLVIGGGPIGMELAQAFAMLGSKVTIAERGAEFARLEDESIRPIIQTAFDKLGITIHSGQQRTAASE